MMKMKEKVVLLKPDKGYSVEEMKKNMELYRAASIPAMMILNGRAIYSDSDDLDCDFFKAIHKLSDEEYSLICEMDQSNKMEQKILLDSICIDSDEVYKYYLGLAKMYVKEDMVEEFEKSMIVKYALPTKYNYIRLTASLMFSLEEEDKRLRYKEFNQIFASVATDEDRKDLSFALATVRRYGQKGDKIDDTIFANTLTSFQTEQKQVITDNSEKIKKLIFQYE